MIMRKVIRELIRRHNKGNDAIISISRIILENKEYFGLESNMSYSKFLLKVS